MSGAKASSGGQWSRLERLFGVVSANQFDDSPQLIRRLRTIIVAFLFVMVGLTLYYLAYRTEPLLLNVAITGGSALLFSSLLWLLARGALRLTGIVLVAYLYCATTVVALSFDGIYDTSLVVYFLLIAISGLLLGAGAALAASIGSVFALAVVYGVDLLQGGIMGPQQLPFLKVVEMGGLLVVMGVVLRLTIADLNNALAHARRENAERKTAQKALARARNELEERVAARTAQLARANLELSTLIQSSRNGVLFVTTDLHLAVVNARAIELLQLPGEADVWQGRPVGDLLKALNALEPDLVEDIRRKFGPGCTLRRSDTPEGEFEVGTHTINWYAMPVAVEGEARQLIILEDVSAEREAEQMRHDLVHAMVHDLRNPLSGMLSLLGLLDLLDQHQKEPLSERQRRYVGQLTESVEHMTRLVNNILDLSRLESGQMPLQLAPLRLEELVRDIVDTQRPLAAARQLSLKSTVAPDLPPVNADKSMIERVLQNLVDNAIKFTPPGGTVRLDALLPTPGDKAPGKVRLVVSDTGPGVPAEMAPRLFQKFAAGDHHAAGSGLGLAFCRLAVEAHGGRLWLSKDSEPGATFMFTL